VGKVTLRLSSTLLADMFKAGVRDGYEIIHDAVPDDVEGVEAVTLDKERGVLVVEMQSPLTVHDIEICPAATRRSV